MRSSRKIRRVWEMDLSEIRFRLSQRVRVARESRALMRGDTLRPDWSTPWVTARVEDSRLRQAIELHDEGATAESLGPYFTERLIDRFCPLNTSRQKLVDT